MLHQQRDRPRKIDLLSDLLQTTDSVRLSHLETMITLGVRFTCREMRKSVRNPIGWHSIANRQQTECRVTNTEYQLFANLC